MLYNKYKVLICILLLEFLFLDSPSSGALIFLYMISWEASGQRVCAAAAAGGSRWNADLLVRKKSKAGALTEQSYLLTFI